MITPKFKMVTIDIAKVIKTLKTKG